MTSEQLERMNEKLKAELDRHKQAMLQILAGQEDEKPCLACRGEGGGMHDRYCIFCNKVKLNPLP